ncbi:MAG: hypothetical protein WBD10_11830, partial [Acidobacteriaceae bacterium]
MKGGVAIEQVEALADVPGLKQGEVQLDLAGSGNKAQFTVNGTTRVSGASYHAGSIHVTNVRAEARLHLTQDEIELSDMRARLSQGGSIDGELKITH